MGFEALEWGMQTPDSRGRMIVDMAAKLRLIVANTTTFRRSGCDNITVDTWKVFLFKWVSPKILESKILTHTIFSFQISEY